MEGPRTFYDPDKIIRREMMGDRRTRCRPVCRRVDEPSCDRTRVEPQVQTVSRLTGVHGFHWRLVLPDPVSPRVSLDEFGVTEETRD